MKPEYFPAAQFSIMLFLGLVPPLLVEWFRLRHKFYHRDSKIVVLLLFILSFNMFNVGVYLITKLGLIVPGDPRDFDSPGAMAPVLGILYGGLIVLLLLWPVIKAVRVRH